MSLPAGIQAVDSILAVNGTTFLIDMPASVAAGGKLWGAMVTDGAPTTGNPIPDGWTGEWVGGDGMAMMVIQRPAAGNEGGTQISVALDSPEKGAARFWYAPPGVVGAVEISPIAGVAGASQPDAPAFTPAGGADNITWLAVMGHDNGSRTVANPAGYPTDYATGTIEADFGHLVDTGLEPGGGGAGSNVGTSAGAGLVWGSRLLNAATEDPPAFGLSTTDGTLGVTIAIYPAGVDAVAPEYVVDEEPEVTSFDQTSIQVSAAATDAEASAVNHFLVATPFGATDPTDTEVIAGQASGGGAAEAAASAAGVANGVAAPLSLSGLSAGVQYRISHVISDGVNHRAPFRFNWTTAQAGRSMSLDNSAPNPGGVVTATLVGWPEVPTGATVDGVPATISNASAGGVQVTIRDRDQFAEGALHETTRFNTDITLVVTGPTGSSSIDLQIVPPTGPSEFFFLAGPLPYPAGATLLPAVTAPGDEAYFTDLSGDTVEFISNRGVPATFVGATLPANIRGNVFDVSAGTWTALDDSPLGSINTGALDGTLTPFTGSLVGDQAVPNIGVLAGTLQRISGQFTAQQVDLQTGSLAGTLTGFAGSFTGASFKVGTLSAAINKFSGSLTGDLDTGQLLVPETVYEAYIG